MTAFPLSCVLRGNYLRAVAAAGMALAVVAPGCGGIEVWGPAGDLRLNEIVSNNAGVWVDELGETDDYIELYNAGSQTLQLARFTIEDSKGLRALPAFELPPGQVKLLWADEDPEQGSNHLDFKVSAAGEVLRLRREDGTLVDSLRVPALAEHHAFMRIPDGTGTPVDCGWATPNRLNGSTCGPPPPPELPPETTFAPYHWPEVWPSPPSPLALNELALRPADFIEVVNLSQNDVALAEYTLSLAPHEIGHPWPLPGEGQTLIWPPTVATLGPGQRVVVPVTSAELAAIAASEAFEGVATIWRQGDGSVVDRVDFTRWPEGAVLARVPDGIGLHRYCRQASASAVNDGACDPLPSRPVGDRLRYLRTPADHAALAAARQKLGTEGVEFVIDMQAGDVVSLLDSGAWDLHYTFVREVIQKLPHLDRCVVAQREEFNRGWYEFSEQEYFRTEGRRYLLGTLVRYAGSDLGTVEFTPGDTITPEQMLRAFFTVTRHVAEPKRWALRPQSPGQVMRMKQIEGQVPIVDINAPFRGLAFQPLTTAVAYGTLRFVPGSELGRTELGPHDIVITDQVPNDIPFVAGLITEAFQTPLAHVNVLSRGRGTPNLALPRARLDPQIAPNLGQLVRFEVTGATFSVRAADPNEAIAFWQSRAPQGPPLVPRLDTSVRGMQNLATRGFADLPSLGGKAAQLAELGQVLPCTYRGTFSVPTPAFAIPVVHSLEHFESSGALALLAEVEQNPNFWTNASVRGDGLAKVRARVSQHPVDPILLQELATTVRGNWPGARIKMRSSSNTEDLAGFNGAGLYTSIGVESEADVEANTADLGMALKGVWSSLFSLRAFDERTHYNIDPSKVAMAVLVHQAYPSESANGVAVSRDILDPERGDRDYLNAQVGEALVTNPAPGVSSDEITYSETREPHIVYHARSSLSGGQPVLTESEVAKVACNLTQVHRHFRPIIDPEGSNGWFAMDVEFKFIGPTRQLVFKQARPYSFGREVPSGWCDF